MREPVFNFNKETNMATCTLKKGNKYYTGHAICHADDLDMMTEKTGYEIAYRRAKINMLRDIKNELKIKKEAYVHLHSLMSNSKSFNLESYENKTLRRQIRLINDDLATTKEILATEEQMLREYITEKDKFYKRIRANRKKADLN